MDCEALVERLRAALGSRDEVLEAYLFGSRARGDASDGSDIDVAVFVDEARAEPGPWGIEAGIAADLMVAAGDDRVDVSVLNRASPLLYHRVLRDGVRLLAKNPRETTVREGRALSRYFDWIPQQRKIDAVSRARIRAGRFGR